MSNHDQHDHEPARAGVDSIGAKGAARRRFTKAGLGASGVILTLASKPGMAATGCVAASGFNSTHASHKPAMVCEGRSPGYWKNWPDQWYGANTNPQVKFGDVFGSAGSNSALAALTMIDVLDPPKVVASTLTTSTKDYSSAQKVGSASGSSSVTDVDPDNVARHIVAALLNARSGRVSAPVERDVLAIWKQYATTGTYIPRPGIVWNGPDIVFYLKSTMI